MGKTVSRKPTRAKKNIPNEGELFIVPPNILQKLGISLGDIATQQSKSKTIPEDTEKNRKKKNKTSIINGSDSIPNEIISHKELFNNKPIASGSKSCSSLLEKALTSKTSRLSSSCEIVSNVQDTYNDVISIPSSDSVSIDINKSDSSTSILETATLMKKSVFLSPSFCNTDFVNTFHDEISQESSNNVSVMDIEPKENKKKVVAENLQNICASSKSFDSSDAIPVLGDSFSKIHETAGPIHNPRPVSAKDKFSGIDEDIPLSQLKISLQKAKSYTMPETEILTSSDKSSTNLQDITSLNSKGKNNNENIMVNKNMVPFNLDPVNYDAHNNVESNKDTSKTSHQTPENPESTSESYNSHSMGELIENAVSKIIGEGQIKNVDNNLPLDDSSSSNFQYSECNDLNIEDVDHCDEENTSEINNYSNQEVAPVKVVKEPENLEKNSKIKIISEEIIDCSQLKEIKVPFRTNKLQLTPVSIETKILKDTSCNGGGVYNSKQETLVKSYAEHNLNADSNGKDSVSECKVKEIADYLSKFIKKRKSNQIIRYDKKIAMDCKRNNSNSKLSAQGVEKPGGEESNRIKLIKTYSHSRKIKKSEMGKIDWTNKLNLKLSTANIDCKDVSSHSNIIPQEWCICSDFGNFDVYCENETYEHIHFWYHKKPVSRPEIIYSIYSEDGFYKDNLNEIVESDTDDPGCAIICWYNINEAEHINDKGDNLPDDLNKKRPQKKRRISFKDPLDMKTNTALSSSDVNNATSTLNINKDEISSKKLNAYGFRRHSIKSTDDECKLTKPSTKDINTLSQSNILSHCLVADTSTMTKVQKVTRNSGSRKEDSKLIHDNNVKDDVTSSNATSHTKTRRKSLRLSLHESSTVDNSITKDTEVPSTSATKKSTVIETENPVKRTRNSVSAVVLDTKAKNKDSKNTKANETENRAKITEPSSTSATKKSPVIDIEKPVRRNRNAASAESVNKITNDRKLEDSTILKAKEMLKVTEALSPSANKKSYVAYNNKPVKRTTNSTSVEVPFDYEKAYSSSQKTLANCKEKPLKRTRTSINVEVVDTNKQFEQSTNLKSNDTLSKNIDPEVQSTSAIKKSSTIDRDRLTKQETRNYTSAEGMNSHYKIASLSTSNIPVTDKEKLQNRNLKSTGIEVVGMNTNKQFEKSKVSKSNDSLNKNVDTDVPSISDIKKTYAIDKDKPTKRETRNSNSVEGISVHYEKASLSPIKTPVNDTEKLRKGTPKSTSVEKLGTNMNKQFEQSKNTKSNDSINKIVGAEVPSTLATKKSSVTEKDKRETRNSMSAEGVSVHYEKASLSPIKTPVNGKENPQKSIKKSTNLEEDIKNMHNQQEQSINSKANEILNKHRITEVPSTSSIKKIHITNEKPVKRTRHITSIEVSDNKSGNKNHQLDEWKKSKASERLNKTKVNEASTSVTKNSVSHHSEKDIPLNRIGISTSKNVLHVLPVNNIQLEQSGKSKASGEIKIINAAEAPSISATKKSPEVNKNNPVKCAITSTSVEVFDNKAAKNNYQVQQSIDSSTCEIINKTRNTDPLSTLATKKTFIVDKEKAVKSTRLSMNEEALDINTANINDQQSIDSSEAISKSINVDASSSLSILKSSSANKNEPKKRLSRSIEASNKNNELDKSTVSQPCETKKNCQRKPSTTYKSDSHTKDRETVEIAIQPEDGLENIESQEIEITASEYAKITIKQEIKIELLPQDNEDVISSDEPSVSGVTTPINNSLTTCGVCNEVVGNESWQEHLKSHNYLAWKATEQSLNLDDREEVKQYLLDISRTKGGLYCSKCGIVRKYPKSYLNHIDVCDGNTTKKLETSTASAFDTTQESVDDTNDDSSVRSKRAKRQKVDEMVKCGVCKAEVWNTNWIEHIRTKHQYMAKREGEIPLDEDDEEEVKSHLHNISKYHGGLICHRCGTNRRYAKVYLDHIKTCSGVPEEVEDEDSDSDEVQVVTCAVCKMDLNKHEWYNHIQIQHKYMAWIEGRKPLNVDDPQEVVKHLQKVVKKTGQLYCWYCNEPRKLARIFLQHVKICESSGYDSKPAEQNPDLSEDQFECGVCHEVGKKGEWRKHAVSKHYNIAWMVGETPINIKNIYAVDKYLKYYQTKYPLVCKVCGASRTSCFGFYAHILICGKSDEELEELRNICEICNKKYVCVYKNQHMAAHKDSELRKARRQREAEIKKEKEERDAQYSDTGKRRAAEKAQKVLTELISDDEDGEPVVKKRRMSDSNDFLKIEEDSNDESDSSESEIDSDLSDEEENDAHSRIRKAPLPKVQRIPFKIDNVNRYLRQAFLDYQKYHLTYECLYDEWRHTQLKSVSEASKYIPTVNTSCKIKWDGGEWCTLDRFRSVKNLKSLIVFAGGCIQCMSWVPEDPVNDSDFYLSISTHRGPDLPRYNKEKIAVHPGLIQIWSFGEFRSDPVLALGIAHNFGTIWAMDWCASGARDALPSNCEDKTKLRLGLLAVACSSGDAYILSVPYPPDVNDGEMMICEAHPVAELRLNYSSKKKYQATSICWNPQKGHSTVLVGYADGTTALYDLNTMSPLLKERSPDSNVTIVYPFLDKKTENAPISALSVCPTIDGERALGSALSGGATGASVWGGGAAGAELRTALAARAAAPAPLWPAHRLLAEIGVSGKVVNEVDWWSGGRRLGPMCASAACERCGAAAVAAPPAVRLVRAHPAQPEIKKRIIATLQMIPINQKVPVKEVKDENAIVVQPFTYKDAVGKYGIEFKMVSKKDIDHNKVSEELEQRADRFPLSEVTAASFCPSNRYHNRLALASHAGVVFIINATN